VTLVEDLPPGKVVEMAQRVGLGADWPLSLTLALGTGSVTPLGLANAYATLADEGHHAPPTLVDRVVSADGRVLWEAPLDRQPVMDPEVAYLTLSLMKSVVETGTAWRIRELGRPVAGKTGTTNEARDAWFAGCLPGMCAAVWVGMDDNSPMGPEEFGGRAAAPIWLDFFKTILTDAPARDFPVPPGVETRVVDPRTGLLAGPNQPDGIVEYFLTGTVPNIMASEAAAGRPDEWLGQ
jgi:penicillin-binding protein 1A